jgi:hypothetical protein
MTADRSRGCQSSLVRIAADAVASLQRHVEHLRDDRAPNVLGGPLEQRESLTRTFQDASNEPPRGTSCSMSGCGTTGQAAVTQIRSYGACSVYPIPPSPWTRMTSA